MNKLILIAALVATMGAASATEELRTDCSEKASWTEKTLYKAAELINKDLGYTVVDGMQCVVVGRPHEHTIVWLDGLGDLG